MLDTLRRHLGKDNEEGFTLIELMVVVLIIAILIAIAIPTFLGAQNRARDRGAQSDLRNAMTAVRTISTDASGLFTTITASSLTAAEGALTWGAAPGTTAIVGWDVDVASSPNLLQLTKVSASGTAFGIRMNSNGQVYYCSNAAVTAIDQTTEACALPSW